MDAVPENLVQLGEHQPGNTDAAGTDDTYIDNSYILVFSLQAYLRRPEMDRQKTDFYLLLIPAEKPFKTKFLSRQIGTARLSFADGEQMEEYLNITPGSLSLMGLIFDKEKRVHLVIDKEVLEEEYFGCHPCINTSSLLMKTSDVKEKILPALGHEYQVVELPTE